MCVNNIKSEYLSLAWWNTGLSPKAVIKDNTIYHPVCHAMVDFFINNISIDILGLCEVSINDINYLKKSFINTDYTITDGIEPVGRSKFDTCVIYKNTKLEVINTKTIISSKGNSHLRIAQLYNFRLRQTGDVFHVFFSHWPSRLHCHENDSLRQLYGIRLRDSIENIFLAEKDKAKIILMGDYNDEPFNTSLSDYLMATRDKELVKTNSNLLFNPFWRYFDVKNICNEEDYTVKCCGSYFYNKGTTTKWHTFDQIIVSSAFISDNSSWKLNDKYTQIVLQEEYLNLINKPNVPFDHLPVMSLVEKE